MFLSVSIPVYNAEKHLDQCVHSVMNQTETDFELILVDDGSKDHSLDICKKWGALYPDKIRVIQKENSGSLFTRRVCLQESKGKYLYVMDADDCLIDPTALKTIHEVIEKNQCDLVFFNCTSNIKTREKVFQIPFEDGKVFEGEGLKEFRKFLMTGRGLKPLWNKVFHRSLVDWDTDYSPYSEITNGTDYFQSTPIVSNAKKAYYLDRVLYFYRVADNEKSIVHTFKKTIYTSARANFIRMSEEAKKWGIEETELWAMLSRAYMQLASTSAYKARLIRNNEMDKVEYLRMIGEDPLFSEYYHLKLTKGLPRKVIVLLLHMKKYQLLFRLM